MRIIARKTLIDFWNRHKDSEQPLKSWFQIAKTADWKKPSEIKEQFRNASFIANNKIVFNISGNKYRLVVAVNYKYQMMYIRFIGTHKEYDKIDIEEV